MDLAIFFFDFWLLDSFVNVDSSLSLRTSAQNWSGLGHKYLDLHQSWKGRKYSLNLLPSRWKGSKKKLLVGRILSRQWKDVWHNKIISILEPGVLNILLSRHIGTLNLCTDPWKVQKRVLMICWYDVVWVLSGDNHIVWCQMRRGQKPEAIADTEILYEPHQEINLDSGFHQHFIFFCWKKTRYHKI